MRRALAWSVVVHRVRRVRPARACTSPTSRRCAGPWRCSSVPPAYVLTDGFPVDGLGVPGLGDVEGRPGGRLHLGRQRAGQGHPRPDHDRAATTRFPAYDFKTHKGYITDEHAAALTAHGPCPEHRMRFVNVRRAAGLEPAPEVHNDLVEESR